MSGARGGGGGRAGARGGRGRQAPRGGARAAGPMIRRLAGRVAAGANRRLRAGG